MLESASTSDTDPFKRSISEQPDFVHVEGDTNAYKSWKIDRIVDKQGDRYLIRWKE